MRPAPPRADRGGEPAGAVRPPGLAGSDDAGPPRRPGQRDLPEGERLQRGHEVLEDVAIFRYPLPFEAAGALGFALEFAWCFVATALLSLWVALFGPRLRRAARLQPAGYVLAAGPVLAAVRAALHLRSPRPVPGDVRGQVRPRAAACSIAALLWLERQSMRAARRRHHHQRKPQGDRDRRAAASGPRTSSSCAPARTSPGSSVYPPDPAYAPASRICSSISARSASRTASTTWSGR